MTEEEKMQLSLRIATAAEKAGLPADLVWEAAEKCPQGHDNILGTIAGNLCLTCLEKWLGPKTAFVTYRLRWDELEAQHDNPDWHPEWRIGKQAKDLTNPSHILPVVEAWLAKDSDREWASKYHDGEWIAWVKDLPRYPEPGSDPDRTVAEALTLCAAMEAERSI